MWVKGLMGTFSRSSERTNQNLCVILLNPLTSMSDQDRISPYNIKQTSDGDYKLIQYQILQTNITRTV